MKITKFFLICLLTLIVLLTLLNETGYLNIEFHESIFEFFQICVILSSLIFLYKKRTFFIKKFTNFQFKARFLAYLFVLYEEISFITKNFSDKFYNFNAQGELNLHNTISALKFPDWFSFPLIGTLEVETVLYSIILFFLSWGSYFINAKKINSFFLNKDFSIFGSIYILERIVYWSLSIFPFISSLDILHLIDPELMELYIYAVFGFDLISKSRDRYPVISNK